MRFSGTGRLNLALLIITAIFVSIWLDGRISKNKLRLPEGWKLKGETAANIPGAIDLRPGSSLSFNGLAPFTRNEFEIELSISISEYDRIAVGAGPVGKCDKFQVETSLGFSGGALPPSRINIVNEGGGFVMYYEGGRPIRRLAEDISGAECFILKTINSKLEINDFKVAGADSGYRQSFLMHAPASKYLPVILIVAAALLLANALSERRIAALSEALTIQKAARSLTIGSSPLAFFSLVSLFSSAADSLVPIAVLWLIFTRFRYRAKYSPFFRFDPTAPIRIRRSLILVTLFGACSFGGTFYIRYLNGTDYPINTALNTLIVCALLGILTGITRRWPAVSGVVTSAGAVMGVCGGLIFVSLLIPAPAGQYIRGVALPLIPFMSMCLLAGHKKKVPLYNGWMLVMAAVLVIFAELGLSLTPMADRLKPMNLNGEYKRHDLLLWVPMDFFSEDGLVQVQEYSIPKIKFRSGAASAQKPEGVYRIAVMGGSNTWGDGIEDPQKTFSAVIERKLNETRKTDFEVINAGVKGYSAMQAYVLFKHYVAEYKPDMAIFYILRNDLVQNYGVYTIREMYRMATDKKLKAVRGVQNTLAESLLYKGLSEGIIALRRDLAGGTGYKMNLKPTKSDTDFKLTLKDIANACDELGIKLVLAVEYQSADHALGYDYRETDLERHMVEFARNRSIPLVNVNSRFYSERDWSNMVLPHDIVHLSEFGHKQVGNYIAEYLISKNLIP